MTKNDESPYRGKGDYMFTWFVWKFPDEDAKKLLADYLYNRSHSLSYVYDFCKLAQPDLGTLKACLNRLDAITKMGVLNE